MSDPNDANDPRFRTQNVARQAGLQGVELASFRSRALAFVIEASVVAALLLVLMLEFGSLVSFAGAVLYFGIATYVGKGATLGKRLLGIRVVSLIHRHLSLWHCIEQALGYAASSLEAGFGFLQFLKHPNRQTVHDRIAEAIVVVNRYPKLGRNGGGQI